MKTVLILACVAATALAAPFAGGKGDVKILADKKVVDIDKLDLGGLQVPSSLTASMNTKAAPENFGNLNLGSGMMPSQIVHYGTESSPHHSGYIQPTLVHATGGHTADVQQQQPEHALVNANLDRFAFDRTMLLKAGHSPEAIRTLLKYGRPFAYPHKAFYRRDADDELSDDDDAADHEKWWRGGGGGGWGGGGWGGGRGGWGGGRGGWGGGGWGGGRRW
ncbi:hypothetical protein DFQ26_003659 [Actinomortierella ambigua]|nr:hypothetical protein DFQ26_003659 [Actinomortierella ambigua]